MRIGFLGWMVLGLFLAFVPSARALTLCVSPCPTFDGTIQLEPLAPIDLSPLDLSGIDGITIGPAVPESPIVTSGTAIVHLPSGLLLADDVDWRAAGRIVISEPITINVGDGTIHLCAPICDPFPTATLDFEADPFHLSVLAPISGVFSLWAGGDIVVTTVPVPEPDAGLLVGLGLALLSRDPRWPSRSRVPLAFTDPDADPPGRGPSE
jgi:hypothetical protein